MAVRTRKAVNKPQDSSDRPALKPREQKILKYMENVMESHLMELTNLGIYY